MKAAYALTPPLFDAPALSRDRRFDTLTRLARRHSGVRMAALVVGDADARQLLGCDGSWPEVRFITGPLSASTLGSTTLAIKDFAAEGFLLQDPLIVRPSPVRRYVMCPIVPTDSSVVGALLLVDDHPGKTDEDGISYLADLVDLARGMLESDTAALRLKREEKALRASERTMALAIAGSETGIWDRNVMTGEIQYSPGWKALLGYAESEVGNRILESYTRVHPEDLSYVQNAMQDHFDQKTENYEVEHRLQCKDGSYKWVCSRGKVVSRDLDGRALRMIGTTTDITAMRLMSEKLRQTLELVTNLTNEVPGLVFQVRRTPAGEPYFSYASAGIREIYELEPSQVAGNAAVIDSLIHPDDLPAYRASLAAAVAKVRPWHLEYRVILPTQGLRWRQGDARPQRHPDGGTVWHGLITDITDRKRIEAELHEFATQDFLTGLPNRRCFLEETEQTLKRMQRGKEGIAAVLMCDLDHFKSINDQWGHSVGDDALRHFAQLLRQELRKSDFAGRIGGEEFAVLLRGSSLNDATHFARRLQRRTERAPMRVTNVHIRMTVSVGITLMRTDDPDAVPSLSRSDMALYRAKANGRNRIEVHT